MGKNAKIIKIRTLIYFDIFELIKKLIIMLLKMTADQK